MPNFKKIREQNNRILKELSNREHIAPIAPKKKVLLWIKWDLVMKNYTIYDDDSLSNIVIQGEFKPIDKLLKISDQLKDYEKENDIELAHFGEFIHTIVYN
jgi:hypothetical protein